MFIFRNFIISVLLIVVFGLINYTYENPNVYNLIVTIAYLLLWFGYGVIMGKKNEIRFIYFSIFLWLGLFIIAALPYFIINFGLTWDKNMVDTFRFIIYLSNIVHSPLYGFEDTTLYYWISQVAFKYSIQVFVIIPPLITTLLGYFLGRKITWKLSKKVRIL